MDTGPNYYAKRFMGMSIVLVFVDTTMMRRQTRLSQMLGDVNING